MRFTRHHVLQGKLGAAAGRMVLRKIIIARWFERFSKIESVSYFSEAIGID